MKSTLPNWGIRLLLALIFLVSAETLQAQVSVIALPYSKSDNFNAYNPTTNAATAAATLPEGWTLSGSTVYNGRGTGSSATGGYYAFGTSGDFSLGSLRSGSLVISYAVNFTNNSSTTITDLTLSWNYEQWRFANNSGWNATGTGALASNATLNGKDFAGTSSGTNGTVATTPVSSFTLTGLTIAPGQSFGIKWESTDGTSADNGVSIDDFSIQASGIVVQDQTITFDPLANATYGDSTISLGATASSGLAVGYASSNENVATISGSTLTIVGAGTTNITASQAGNAAYHAADNVVQPFTVDPKNLTVSGATAQNKTYDRNTDAAITGATAVGTVNGDAITLVGGGSFDDFNFGTGKTVTAALTLSGAKAASYTLTQPTGLSADIAKKDLTIADAEAEDKLFDGNTDAVITGTLSGVIAPDSVDFLGTGTFATSAVGENIAVTSTAALSGDSLNYNLVQPTGLTANIYAEALLPQTITFDPLANATYGDASFNLTATASSTLTVTYSSSNTDVATITGNTVTIVGVGTTTITAMQDGNGTYEEAEPVTQTLTVDPKALTVTAAVADNKTYDGNADATFTGTLNGIVNTDDVTLNGTGTFLSAAANTAIVVTSTATLGGTDAANYTLTQPTGLFADITPKALTANSATANDKVYDGNADASISNLTLTGIVGTDDVSATGSGTFASEDVDNNISVTANLSLMGEDAGNYTLTQPTGLSADITPLALTLTGLTGNNKVYDRLTTATLSGTPVLGGFVISDDVFANGTPTANFNNRNVGTGKPITVSGYTLSGTDAGNYTLIQPTGITANITQAPVTISGAAAQNKPFDGTTAAVITGTLSGVISPDVVTLTGTGTFASAAVGNGIAVTSTSTLGGAAAANYTIDPQPTGLTANITPGPTILAPGDLSIIGFNVNTPDNFAFVCWVDIDNGTYIKFTDNAFLSSNSANAANNGRGGENFVIWRNNGATIPAGTVITINDTPSTNLGTIISGNLNGLAGGGDNIFAYQGSATSGSNPDWSSNSNPATFTGTILFGLQMQSNWLTSGGASSNASYLPSELNFSGRNIALTGAVTRGQYTGSRNNQLTLAAYKTMITTTSNWTTATGSGVVTLNTTPFVIASGPTASELSGAGTICAGDTANLYVFITGGIAPYKVTYSDGSNNFTVDNYNSGSSIPVIPSVTTSYTLVSVEDANQLTGTGNTGTAEIIVNQLHPFFADVDGDGYGTGTAVNICAVNASTPPAGYAVQGGDCNDAVASIHPNAVEVPYNGVDDDCDGTIDETGTVTTTLLASSCGVTLTSIGSLVGIQTVGGHPITGYRIRITNGSEVQMIEKTVPHFTIPQFPSYAYATTYTVDIQLQRAGIWQASWGATCLVSTPAILEEGGAAAVSPSQCGITLPKINTLIATTSLAGVTGYRFRVTNLTDPLGPNAVQTIDRTQNWFSLPMLTRYNFGTTYRIEVAVKTTGAFGGFGSPCEVSSPAVPSLVNCGGTVASGTATIAATSVEGATQYRFQIVRQSDNASTTIDRSQNWFIFNSVPASAFTAGALYGVRVAVMTKGTWSPFGDVCEITAPGAVARPGVSAETEASAGDVFKATAYPNPYTADFSLNVISSSKENVQLQVYDMLGKLIETTEITTDSQLGNNYPSGVYNLIIRQGDAVKTLRVIKR